VSTDKNEIKVSSFEVKENHSSRAYFDFWCWAANFCPLRIFKLGKKKDRSSYIRLIPQQLFLPYSRLLLPLPACFTAKNTTTNKQKLLSNIIRSSFSTRSQHPPMSSSVYHHTNSQEQQLDDSGTADEDDEDDNNMNNQQQHPNQEQQHRNQALPHRATRTVKR
jgi:hypothetical protein